MIVSCDHILLLNMMNSFGRHDLLGFLLRFDPEKGQDIEAEPEKAYGFEGSLALSLCSCCKDNWADQIKGITDQ